MKLFVVLLAFAAIVFNSGCSKNSAEVDCGSDEALAALRPILTDKFEHEVSGAVRSADGERHASGAQVRAAVRQVDIKVDQVRTTNRDPNSTKRFCSGILKLTFPTDVVETAERTREMSHQDNVDDLADRNNIERAANRFDTAFDYSIQPTDDGTHIFAEVAEAENVYRFVAGLLGSHLMNNEVQQAQARHDAELAGQRQQEAQQQAEETAAAAEQRAAELSQAKSEQQSAIQLINTVWQNIPSSTRSGLQDAQRQWLRLKVANCRVEGAAASTDAQEREVARLRCEANQDRERAGALRQYVGVEASQDEGD